MIHLRTGEIERVKRVPSGNDNGDGKYKGKATARTKATTTADPYGMTTKKAAATANDDQQGDSK
jgi:hypothetical protein